MARRRTTKKKTTSRSAGGAATLDPGRARLLEAVGVLILMVAAALFFALLTFDPTDRAGDGNLVGPVGAGVARMLIGGVGVMGYVVCAAVAALSGAVFVGRARVPRPLAIASAVALTIASTVLAHLVAPERMLFGHSAGGMLGAVIGEVLRSVIGTGGAALVAVAAVLVSLLGTFDISFSAAARDTSRLFRWLGTNVLGQASVWWAARRAAREREAEVLAEKEALRIEAESEREAKDRALREKLEEKKRVAVMKAEAKAEERALAKIAAADAKARIEAEQAAEALERQRLEEEARAAEPPPEIIETTPSEKPVVDQGPQDDEEEEEEEEEEFEDEDEGPEVIEAEAPDDVDASEVDESGNDGPQIIEMKATGPNKDVFDSDSEDGLQINLHAHAKMEYKLPPLKLLDYDAPEEEPIDPLYLRARATRLEDKLRTYGVDGKVTAIRPGPVVTTYEYQPAPGVKVAKISGLSDDIAMSMEARSVRIIAPIPGRGVVGIELPNSNRETVYLKEIIAHDRFLDSKSLLTIAMGKDAEGEARVANLQKMPHLLVAGTTGSGKSVSTNAMILSILYKATPDQVKFIMVDPKMLELSLYEGIPHLLLPVVTDAKKASLALQWAVDEMERRYKLLSGFKVRNIDGFNSKLALLRAQRERRKIELDEDATPSEIPVEVKSAAKQKVIHDPWVGEELPNEMPYIVVLIDEFADLMCVAPRDVESAVQRLAQKARAAGVHLIIATQRPSTDVITGVIKNNLPTRMAFRVASRHDSATIINAPGAENLLGMGDMLHLSQTAPTPLRVHGAFVTEEEVQRVADFWKAQAKPTYDKEILKPRDAEDGGTMAPEDYDEHYDQAVAIVTETQKASISALQRRLRVGYNRAARMIEVMEKEGVVSSPSGPKGEREVLVRPMGPDGPG